MGKFGKNLAEMIGKSEKKLKGIRKAILFVFDQIFGLPMPDFMLLTVYNKKRVLKG